MKNEDLLDEGTLVYRSSSFPDALVGRECQEGRAVYSYRKMVESLIKDGMSEEDAVEWIEYNTLGRKGDGFPIVVEFFEEAQ